MRVRLIAVLLAVLFSMARATAQFMIDPGLAAMIPLAEDRAKKALQAQLVGMDLITTGHVWTKEEMKEVYNLQKQYNAYLDQFNGILIYAAQSYGFYHEIGKLTENYGKLCAQLRVSPSNAVAVALTPKRNKIYRDLILASVDVVNDIRMVCLSDLKMTEKERVEIVFGIRPKLRNINRKLTQLVRAVKYTSLSDVWLELDNRARDPLDKNRISSAAFRRWRQCGKIQIKPGDGTGRPPGGSSRPPDGVAGPVKPLNPADSAAKPGLGGELKPVTPNGLKPIGPVQEGTLKPKMKNGSK